MTVDKELLFKSRLPEADVDVPGLGVTVRVRGLSRAEAMQIQKLEGTAAIERAMLAMALVDPQLSEGEVRQWQEAAPAGELEPITDKVAELSGMKQDSAKDAYKELASDNDAMFRDVPSGQAEANSRPAKARAK